MPLFQRRRQQREKAERVDKGQAVPLTRDFSKTARGRILYAIQDNSPSYLAHYPYSSVANFAKFLRRVLLREYGEPALAEETDAERDVQRFLLEVADREQVLDIIEAFFAAVDESRSDRPQYLTQEEAAFRERVNQIFDEDDIAYQVVDREVVPRESMAMYADVVAPAFSLLHGDSRLTKVERAFHDALKELKPGGSAADAITDAGTALQEMLVALGAQGNALGPLLSSARQKGLLGPYDSKLVEGVQRIGEWVSADRSERGDAHLVKESDSDDAWLAVHVVGALVLRLEKRL